MSLLKIDIPKKLSLAIENLLKPTGIKLSSSKILAKWIEQTSNNYIRRDQTLSPWQSNEFRLAYTAYYTPLNYARARAAIKRVQQFDFFNDEQSIYDWGSGSGVLQMALADEGLENLNYTCWDHLIEARTLHSSFARSLKLMPPQFTDTKPTDAVSTFSYSFNEMETADRENINLSKALIIEPSTNQNARQLMELRDQLTLKGSHVWAPCSHTEPCPLLKNSKKDWCHDRIDVQLPDWFLEIENHLPIRNKTLTFSYLAIKDTPPASKPAARFVGDPLKEKGKSRIMVCKDSNRQFFSRLKKAGPLPSAWTRGQTLDSLPEYETKGDEMRVN